MAARVKICGLTRAADARMAAEAGASAIGVVLWPGSPRSVSIERAAEILRDIPADVMKVGVFVDQPLAFVQSAVQQAQLDAVQLHGGEDPDDYDCGVLVLKSVPVGATFDLETLHAISSRVLPLLDTSDATRRGGTGVIIDWKAAAAASAVRRIMLAGGLTPRNVREALRRVQPFGVDVSSGVEIAPGHKSPELVQAFVDAVRAEAGTIARGPWM